MTQNHLASINTLEESMMNMDINDKYNYSSIEHKPPFLTDYNAIKLSNILFLKHKSSAYITECMKLTIGIKGKNFKKITENNEIAFIYHNKEKNIIEIWGENKKYKTIRTQIIKHLRWSHELLEERYNNIN